jgi:hypothetical protein
LRRETVETGGLGDWGTGGLGDWETGGLGDWEMKRMINDLKKLEIKMKNQVVVVLFFLIANLSNGQAKVDKDIFIQFSKPKSALLLSDNEKSLPMCISSSDYPGVIRAFKDLRSDINKVTGSLPQFKTDTLPTGKEIIIAGTIGKSPEIDKLIKNKKIDIKDINGKWESFLIQVVNKPFPNIKSALVIAGSDKRGTIFGIYEVSKQIGVSPWYWWGDVTPEHKEAIYVKSGRFVQGSPSVKYRGLFLNDEAPALTNWIIGKYGMVKTRTNPPIPSGVANYGHEFYTKLFELMLRLKANYLWPAMWNNAFNEDDPLNPKLADEYGIVMGTSHQEPMLRAQKEWDRRYLKTVGTWNYAKNPTVLESFWREGIKRNKDFESIITIGLRGANDTEMAPGGPAANKTLLEKIVDVQRKIITEETKQDATKIPQLWCLYKEVQDYYKAGMRVPDDVTLLWAEDNWGNVRRLPNAEERKRTGGAGIYYHFDYHGGPRSYQWINTNPIPKIWDQMSLAKQYGADQIWIVNAGHFKGYEFPLDYFLSLAWNSSKFTNENIGEFTRSWSELQFGSKWASKIADIISSYTRFNGRRKPELLEPATYSLTNYNEAEKVVNEYNALTDSARIIYNDLPDSKRNAFYQLVLFPVKASAIVNELYVTAGKNDLYSKQGRAATNDMAARTRELFKADTVLMGFFNRSFAEGKWNHFMDQAHLGYVSWADPPVNSLNAIKLKEITIPQPAKPAISLEGSDAVWPGNDKQAVLPEYDIFNKQTHYFDIFNKGRTPFDYTIEVSGEWIKVSEPTGKIEKEKRIDISIDWSKTRPGNSLGTIKVTAQGISTIIEVKAVNPKELTPDTLRGFVEAEGVVSMEAEHFSSNTPVGTGKWVRIQDYGHTLSGMRATSATDALAAEPGKNSPHLEYRMYLFSTGKFEVTSTFSPTLNFMAGRAQKVAISFDDEVPQIITLVPENYNAQNGNRDWEKTVRDNARKITSTHSISSPGYHTLKIWMVDPGPVLEKIVVNTGGMKPSYLGPPESFRH